MIAINCTEKTSTYCETNLIDVGLMKLRGRTRSGQSCGVGLGLARSRLKASPPYSFLATCSVGGHPFD
jgi:hypothetical protein